MGTLFLAVLLALASACGSSGPGKTFTGTAGGSGGSGGAGGSGGSAGTNNGSGVDGTKSLSALTMDEKGKLCDWLARLVGGYGKQDACGMGKYKPPMSQADCASNLPMCDATVANFEACQQAMAGLQKMCTDTALGDAFSTAGCMAVENAAC
jgi:hypothetical protein